MGVSQNTNFLNMPLIEILFIRYSTCLPTELLGSSLRKKEMSIVKKVLIYVCIKFSNN